MMRRTWTVKDGTKVKIKNMKTSHIRNCIRMLGRCHDALLLQAYSAIDGLHGEMAIECAEDAVATIEENGFGDNADEFLFAFEEELRRREVT
jgi:hypothetical protein